MKMPPASRDFSRKAALVGIGETDFAFDYQAARRKADGYEAPSPESLACTAFERALADSGLKRSDIDGITTSFIYGGPSPQDMAAMLGITPRYCEATRGVFAGPLPQVCADIATGKADVVVMIYAAASRAIGRQYGGATYAQTERTPASYYFYHPWGWSAQAAHWALMFSHYKAQYGVTEADLGAVAMQIRAHAMRNPAAIMQQDMTIADYLAARYIVRPIRLFDLCLVNDGAVCLIVSRADRAKDMAQPPVLVAGWGETIGKGSKMEIMVRDRLAGVLRDAGAQALDMAGLNLAEIGHFEGYDASTIHLINQVEGFGFTPPGTGLDFCKAGEMTLGGRIPMNLGGGNLSGAYMHGWSLMAEVVRQLRHHSGDRQVSGLNASLSAVVQTSEAHPIICERGA